MRREKGLQLTVLAVFLLSLSGSLWILVGEIPGAVDEKGEAGEKETAAEVSHYEPLVLVIDPGHGGFDGGAEAGDGTKEKDINLAIGLYLKELAEQYPIEVVMTRDTDVELISEEEASSRKGRDILGRLEMMEKTKANLAVSIHLNSFPADSGVYGAQVFYPKLNEDEQSPGTDEQKEFSAKEYGEKVQESIEINISDGRQRTAMAKDDILLFQDPPCPIILVECGFLSNPEEAKRLQTAEYQRLLAESIWKGLNEILCLNMKEKLPVIDSANKGETEG